ncbi:MAG: helix-turn-helix transcriptional regulator [Lachnospiraceae bacterium]|nr:helix-turn-helix transcriptional regulator [Lachnospiraceae bacterium]
MKTSGSISKELREKSGFTVEEVIEKLKDYHIAITPEQLYGYENGTDSIDADLFLILNQIYGCPDILEAFSDSNAVQNIPPLDLKHLQELSAEKMRNPM